jgi:hypothetical protein
MPKSKVQSAPSASPYTSSVSVTGGNGASTPDSDANRLARVEAALQHMQRALEVQLQRMADMQVVLDRLVAAKNH